MTAAYHDGITIAGEESRPQSLFERLLPVSFALVYATLLTQLPLDIFKDRANYFTYIGYSDAILARYTAGGLLSTLANEPLWLFLNITLSRLLHPEDVMRVIIFAPAFLVAWQLMRRDPRHAIWMIAFLLSPQVVKNHIIHLRQGVALGVFVVGYFAGPKWLRFGLMAVACFIHSSFLFICVIGVGTWALDELRFSPRARAAAVILCFVSMGILIEFFAGGLTNFAGGLGARQAITYADADVDISGLGFVFWAAMLLLFASSGEEFLRQNMFAFSILAFYLAVYFLTSVSGRIFESGMFLVFLAGLALPGQRRNVFLGAFILFSAILYFMRLGDPWLGFGVW